MCWLEFRFYPLLGAADLPLNADAGIIFENMMCEKTFHRSGTVLLQNRNTEAIQSSAADRDSDSKEPSPFLQRRCKRFGIPIFHVAQMAEEVHDHIGVGNRYWQCRRIESAP